MIAHKHTVAYSIARKIWDGTLNIHSLDYWDAYKWVDVRQNILLFYFKISLKAGVEYTNECLN